MLSKGLSSFNICCRRYASIASGSSSNSASNGSQLTLEHFIQRKRALQLWRSVVRAVNKIPTASSRHEMLDFARTEFERNRFVHDISHIRYLISVRPSSTVWPTISNKMGETHHAGLVSLTADREARRLGWMTAARHAQAREVDAVKVTGVAFESRQQG